MAFEKLHERFIRSRRTRILHKKLARLLPEGESSLLDIGCGDGAVAALLMEANPQIQVKGIDILVRDQTEIPVRPFDGRSIPFESGAFDFSMLVDVLHHSENPLRLLQEAVRVSRSGVIIKDHLLQGIFARQTLKCMDDTHNRRFGVSLPYHYWTPAEWESAFRGLGLETSFYENRLQLYPAWADWIFGRKLDFMGLFLKS